MTLPSVLGSFRPLRQVHDCVYFYFYAGTGGTRAITQGILWNRNWNFNIFVSRPQRECL